MRPLPLLALLVALPAGAATFDFATFPDSAGCDYPVPVLDRAQNPNWEADTYAAFAAAHCSQEFINGWGAGDLIEHIQTIDGVTVRLFGTLMDWGWGARQLACGNIGERSCLPYRAEFSTGLARVSVEFIGHDQAGSPGYYLFGLDENGSPIAYAESVATSLPITLEVDSDGIIPIKSVIFGASVVEPFVFDPFFPQGAPFIYQNMGVVGSIAATPLPEPSTTLVLALGLGVIVIMRRRRSDLPRSRSRLSGQTQRAGRHIRLRRLSR